MNPWQEKVTEFMQAMGQTVPRIPTIRDYPFELRAKLILEEAEEFVAACGLEHSDDDDGPTFTQVAPADAVQMIDAIVDLIVVAVGAASAMGFDLTSAFNEVHRSNMAKLGPDGKPIRREDGKILKPEGWTPPNLMKVYMEACERAVSERRAEEAWRQRRIDQLELELKDLKGPSNA